ncbi:hypothetical protein O6P37_15085 [Mycobacterium sp. CPCC 205372]|uniref:PE family protein n=1 Tax=Mycobacterium hippophais TaxID=3016340 RepID=A0ABT4PUL7_9MYCO|nr:hypothetical protein [Mycobacterium hippophais]MCZ8380196.1 hypothetical protein [Mycobacterium hippophais]
MSADLTAVPVGMQAFATANESAAELLTAAGSADAMAMFMATVAAIGPIGAGYLAAYANAQHANLTGTLLVGGVHAGVSAATRSASTGLTSVDSAFSA